MFGIFICLWHWFVQHAAFLHHSLLSLEATETDKIGLVITALSLLWQLFSLFFSRQAVEQQLPGTGWISGGLYYGRCQSFTVCGAEDYHQTSVSKLPPVVSLVWSETFRLFDFLAFRNVHFLSNPFQISILRGACPMMVYDCLSSGPGTFTAEKKNVVYC